MVDFFATDRTTAATDIPPVRYTWRTRRAESRRPKKQQWRNGKKTLRLGAGKVTGLQVSRSILAHEAPGRHSAPRGHFFAESNPRGAPTSSRPPTHPARTGARSDRSRRPHHTW